MKASATHFFCQSDFAMEPVVVSSVAPIAITPAAATPLVKKRKTPEYTFAHAVAQARKQDASFQKEIAFPKKDSDLYKKAIAIYIGKVGEKPPAKTKRLQKSKKEDSSKPKCATCSA